MYGGTPPDKGGSGNDAALMAALMAAAAQEEQKKKSVYLEAALPVALLIILALIFAVKLGIIDLGFLPFFNQPISILILTDNVSSTEIQEMVGVLQKTASYYKFQTRTLQLTPNRRIFASQLADADVVILYEVEQTPVLSTQQRNEIAKFLSSGGKLIVVKNSGTYIPECEVIGGGCDPDATLKVGWKDLTDFMPVDCFYAMEEAKSCEPETVNTAVIATVDPENPIMKGFEVVPPQGTIDSLEVIKDLQLSRRGRDIADIYEGGRDNPTAVYLGITISSTLTGTKVVHFNYDPWKTPSILINTILYLSGRTR